MAFDQIKYLIIITSVIFFIAPAAIFIYVTIYNQRKKQHIEEKRNLEITFRQELLETQLEVQEQTLTNISRELHDNITQVLSFVKLNLALSANLHHDETQVKIAESRELVSQVINDLRNLSKSLSFEHIAAIGLVKTFEVETKRINNTGIIQIELTVQGEEPPLGEQRELILFRIFQEALNNTLKYAAAQHFKIHLQYSNQLVTLLLEDDGKGFSLSEAGVVGGLGLRNMKSRATLIGADLQIETSPGNGCRIFITLNPITQLKYPPDENDPNRAR